MILASECNGPVKNHPTEYLIRLTPEEYEQFTKGKVLQKDVGCATMSGRIEVRFIKNSDEKHKKLWS